jgi:hypothetical protein
MARIWIGAGLALALAGCSEMALLDTSEAPALVPIPAAAPAPAPAAPVATVAPAPRIEPLAPILAAGETGTLDPDEGARLLARAAALRARAEQFR